MRSTSIDPSETAPQTYNDKFKQMEQDVACEFTRRVICPVIVDTGGGYLDCSFEPTQGMFLIGLLFGWKGLYGGPGIEVDSVVRRLSIEA